MAAIPDDDPAGSIRINDYLRAEAGRIRCRRCGHDHCADDQNYKLSLLCKPIPVTALSPVNRDPAEYVDEPMSSASSSARAAGASSRPKWRSRRSRPIWDVQLRV